MLLGAGIGLAVVVLLLSGTGNHDPSWGEYWMLRPLLVTPLGASMAGIFHHAINYLWREKGWNKFFTILLSILGYIAATFFSIALGFNGTYWD